MDTDWGYVDSTGKWVIPPSFDWATSFNEGLAAVNRKHDCGFIAPSGKRVIHPPVAPGEKDCATVWGDFSEHLVRWKFGDKYGFINQGGEVVIKPTFSFVHSFSEGRAAVQIAGGWGYVDKTGQLVIEPRDLTRAEDFHHGLSLVVTRDGKWGYINTAGKYVWGPSRQGSD